MEVCKLNTYILINVIAKFIFWELLLILPFRKHLRIPLWIAMSLYLPYFISGFFLSVHMFSIYENIQDWRIYISIFYMVILLVMNIILVKINFFQLTFTILVLKGFLDNIYLVSDILQIYCFSDITLSNKNLLLSLITIFTISCPIIWVFMEKFLIPLIDYNKNMSFWKYICIIPLTFYIVYRISIYPCYILERVLWNRNEMFIIFTWIIITYFSYIIILKMISVITKSAKLQEKLYISNIQIKVQKEQYELIKKSIEDTYRVRHDLRYHMLVMEAYTKNRDIDGMKSYLDNYIKSINLIEYKSICENYAIDAVIRYYINIAQEKNINVNYSINIPPISNFLESDLCIVFGNLLENAYEACSRQSNMKQFIIINVKDVKKNILAISIKNSFEGDIKTTNNIFLSSKCLREGIGITSVRTIAEKYNGISNFKYKDNLFEVDILLNL